MKTLFALLVMFALPVFMPVLPIPGLPGLLAGLLGGYFAGRPGRAVQLALLPITVVVVLILLVGLGTGMPLVGGLIAGIALLWLAIEHVALFLGAWIGGFLAERSARERRTHTTGPTSFATPDPRHRWGTDHGAARYGEVQADPSSSRVTQERERGMSRPEVL